MSCTARARNAVTQIFVYLDTLDNKLGSCQTTIENYSDYINSIVATSGFEDEVDDCLTAGFSGVQALQGSLNTLSASVSGIREEMGEL